MYSLSVYHRSPFGRPRAVTEPPGGGGWVDVGSRHNTHDRDYDDGFVDDWGGE